MMKTCLGGDVFYLDTVVVIEENEEKIITREVGATCGNVMSILGWMGWKTYPIARLQNVEESYKMKEDLERFGADTRFVSIDEDGGTSFLKVTHTKDKNGNPKVGVQPSSPKSKFRPNVKHFLQTKAPALLEKLDFVPDVFFFVTPDAAVRIFAGNLKEKGSMIYFEPEKFEDSNRFKKSVELSDIIKYSGERVKDNGFTEEYKNKLFIQTMGADGLQFNLKGQGWVKIDPVANPDVVDWEGAGDWTTSTFLNELGKMDCLDINKMTVENVTAALKEAVAVASKSVSYMAPKGMIYAEMNK